MYVTLHILYGPLRLVLWRRRKVQRIGLTSSDKFCCPDMQINSTASNIYSFCSLKKSLDFKKVR